MKQRLGKNKKRWSRPYEETHTNSEGRSITTSGQMLGDFYQDITNLRNKFGQKIKKERDLRKLSQEELATKAGLDRTYISQIENGKQSIGLDNIGKLANALKLHLYELMRL